MNEEIIKIAAKELEITEKQINAVLELLEQGNTVPFILTIIFYLNLIKYQLLKSLF